MDFAQINETVTLRLLQILVIVLFTLGALWALTVLRRQALGSIQQAGFSMTRAARARTLLHVGLSALRLLVLIVAVLMVMYAFGINVAPVLTGLGIAGLAVSLAAQTLIRDIIGGLIIVLENLYDIGDTITVGPVSGQVERITLRATYLRDLDGRLIVLPNGDVRTVSNASRDWGCAIVDLNIAFENDMAKVMATLQSAMQAAGQDTSIASSLLEPPQVIGWNTLTATGMQVRLMAKTRPGQQTAVANVLRRYATEALLAANVRFSG